MYSLELWSELIFHFGKHFIISLRFPKLCNRYLLFFRLISRNNSTMCGMAGAEALKFAQNVWKMMVQGKGYERILQQVTITGAGNGSCVAEFKVEEGMTNRGGTLHGGCTATLIDCISTIGLMTSKNCSPGVSVNLSVNYLKAAKEGEVVVVSSTTVKSGRKMAFLETYLKNKETGDVIATGSHVKFIGG